MGGARALEWAATYPQRVQRCAVVASCAASTAEQIAFAQTQVLAIRQDPHFAGGDYYDGAAPTQGLGLARRIAQAVDYNGQLVQDPNKPDGAPRKLMDSQRLADLGWRAHTTLAAGLQQAYADFLQNNALRNAKNAQTA